MIWELGQLVYWTDVAETGHAGRFAGYADVEQRTALVEIQLRDSERFSTREVSASWLEGSGRAGLENWRARTAAAREVAV